MANQYQVDPRQALFLKAYIDPKSKTFSNAKQSALSAGYTEEYAGTILSQDLDWLSESLSLERMLKKAERNLDEFLDEPEDKKIKLDATKFVASRAGKAKWSERTELTGAEGMNLFDGLTEEQKRKLDNLL